MTRPWVLRSTDREQVANACDWFPDLTPASDVPAAQTRANWAAVLPDANPPLIEERDCDCDG